MQSGGGGREASTNPRTCRAGPSLVRKDRGICAAGAEIEKCESGNWVFENHRVVKGRAQNRGGWTRPDVSTLNTQMHQTGLLPPFQRPQMVFILQLASLAPILSPETYMSTADYLLELQGRRHILSWQKGPNLGECEKQNIRFMLVSPSLVTWHAYLCSLKQNCQLGAVV